MAAPGRRTQPRHSDSSSDDDELRERLKEAAWVPPGVKQSVQPQKESVTPVIPSSRAQPNKHEHDGNELQTTPEFRAHVAKKLSAILDSCIKEIPGSHKQTSKAESEVEDEGFRLFSTSVPGDTGAKSPSLVPKRRVTASSSEDSEEENERFREAAVSGFDILKRSALPPASVETSVTPSNDEVPKKHKKKKKKKRKDVSEEAESGEQEILATGFEKNKHLGHEDASDQQGEPEQPNGLKKKKKKKKKHLAEETELECQDLQQELCPTKKKLKR